MNYTAVGWADWDDPGHSSGATALPKLPSAADWRGASAAASAVVASTSADASAGDAAGVGGSGFSASFLRYPGDPTGWGPSDCTIPWN